MRSSVPDIGDSGHKAVDSETNSQLTLRIAVMQYLTEAIVADIQYICGGKKRWKEITLIIP